MSDGRCPRVAIVGARGIPAAYGGFETFAKEIGEHLVRMFGYEVTVVCDSEQRKRNDDLREDGGIRLRYSEYSKGNSPIRFYFDSIRKVVNDHDIIYSCGPAGGLFGPLVRYKGRIIMTNPDGLNGKRGKWSIPVQLGFRCFEWASSKFSDRVVCDSKAIEAYIRKRYAARNTVVAEYGAHQNAFLEASSVSDNVLMSYGLKPGRYHLVVSRLEPENNVETIIQGYERSYRRWPLVVVGNLTDTKYVSRLQKRAGENVRFVGGVYDPKRLSVIRANAASYIHGHSVGGTNPSLLEAMASRNLCICHDNPFNREVLDGNGLFFSGPDDIESHLSNIENAPAHFEPLRQGALERIKNYYSWENIAAKYHAIFTDAFAENVR